MKLVGIISTATLSLLLGVAAPAYAQQDQNDKPEEKRAEPAKARQQEEKRNNEVRPNQREEKRNDAAPAHEEKRVQENKADRPEQNRTNDARPDQPREARAERPTPQQQQVQHTAWQQHRANNWQSDHRTWQQRGGYRGYRVPDDHFRMYFGESNGFRIYGQPFLVVDGYPRFQYGGYWVSMVDPWPSDWADDWYDTDDVYVVYVDNGYYLHNRRHPDVGISISFSM